MPGQIRLFEKVNGLLVEIDPASADARRAAGTISHVSISIDVLWTAEEEAARAAEQATNAAAGEAVAVAQEKHAADRRTAIAKLQILGLNADEIAALTGA